MSAKTRRNPRENSRQIAHESDTDSEREWWRHREPIDASARSAALETFAAVRDGATGLHDIAEACFAAATAYRATTGAQGELALDTPEGPTT